MARSSSLTVSPRSTKSTKAGQAAVVSCRCGAAAKASSYDRLPIVTSFPISPPLPFRVAATARRTAGWITSTTGTSYRSRASRRQALDAALQARTSAFTPSSTRWSMSSRLKARTSASGRGPYGVRAVSPTYRTGSLGSWSRIARAPVSPPTPESKMPTGASFPTLPRRLSTTDHDNHVAETARTVRREARHPALGPELALECGLGFVDRSGVGAGGEGLPAAVRLDQHDVGVRAVACGAFGLGNRVMQDRARGDAGEDAFLLDELSCTAHRV